MKKKTKIIILLVIVILIIGGIAVGLIFKNKNNKIEYQTVRVERGNLI